tara:strand:- start:11230 stop:12912 length:1683 start_codon:yes stop_codon:yes gene_type:complete
MKVYIINVNKSGGSYKYLLDIIELYKLDVFWIENLSTLGSIEFNKNDFLIVQNYIFLDCDITTKDIINVIEKYELNTFIPIHNFGFFSDKKNSNFWWRDIYLRPDDMFFCEDVLNLFKLAKYIACPSQFIYEYILKYYNNEKKNLYLVDWIDLNYTRHINDDPCVYKMENVGQSNIINIGALHSFCQEKGSEIILELQKIKTYKNYRINYILGSKTIPAYSENNFFYYIKKYRIHGLLYLNKLGETYCYALSKGLMSGLPIFYNNIGVFKERILDKKKYIKNIDCEDDYNDIEKLKQNYFKFLDYIIENEDTFSPVIFNTELKTNSFFENIFNKSKVSVIIASFNRFTYLLNAIKSVQEQTFKNVEIIVINDGSTQSEYKEHKFSDNIKIIHREKNSREEFGFANLGYVRNMGIKESTGDYIAFLDDDDYWFPNKLERQLIAMRKTKLDICSSNGCFIGENTKEKIHWEKQVNDIYMRNNNFYLWDKNFLLTHYPNSPIICGTLIVKKSLLESVGLMDESPPPGEDYRTWLNLLEKSNSVYINEPLMYYDKDHGDGQLWL